MTDSTMPNDDEIVEAMARAIRDIAWGDGSEPLNAHDDAEELAQAALAAQRAMIAAAQGGE